MKRPLAAIAILTLSIFGAGCTTYHAVPGDAADGPADRPDSGPTDRPADLGNVSDVSGTGEVEASVSCLPDEHACGGTCFKLNDPTNCGVCGRDCSGLPNIKPGAAQCQAGKCVVAADGCVAGRAHCSTNPEDVCETDLTTPDHCGSCTTKCGAATPLCSNTAGTQACVANCGGATPDKCGMSCADLKTDVNNCGTCGKVCSFPNGEAACVNGACVMPRCKVGFGDCSAEPGCETQLNSATNCGACGKSCAVTNGSATCTAGACGPVTCAAGFGDCDTTPGCETTLNTPTNCGKCGTACDATKPLCSTVAGQQTCVSDCSAAAPTKCGTKCVDTKTDVANCGACGTACSFPNADASCVNGQCTMGGCRAGFGDCNAQPGCETPLGTNTNCSACGQACGANLKCDANRTCVDICTGGAAGNASHCCSSTDCPANTPVCNSNHTCVGKPVGQSCSQNAECAMGFCADGVCCNSACTGQCEACNVTLGTCTAVTGAPRGARTACGGDAACLGQCNGSNRTQCAYPTNRCRNASCSGGQQINEAMCDSAGRCPAESRTTCPNVCVVATGMCGGICKPGTVQCPTNTLQTCSSDGSAWVNTMTCPIGCNTAHTACTACNSRQGQACIDPGNECRAGTWDCAGTTCINLTNKGNGTSCMGGNGKCNNGNCVPKFANGQTCTIGSDCQTGNCVKAAGTSPGMICCNTACDACHDCNTGGTGCTLNTSDDRAGTACGTNMVCYFGLGCVGCGNENNFCCDGPPKFTRCNNGLVCKESAPGGPPSESQCQCGNPGQPCCGGSVCYEGTCQNPGTPNARCI